MRRVLVLTWALGTASGVLLGLFGVQLVSARFSTSRVSPLSHPEVLRALQAARSAPVAAEEIALPAASPPDTAVPPPSPAVDAAPARPSAGATSPPAQASPASPLPRPAATAGSPADTAVAAAVPSTTVAEPTTTTAPPQAKPPASPDEPSEGTRTITSDGGVVVVKFADGKVRYQMARPNTGYEVHVLSYGPDYVLVYFDKGNRGYRVWASYYKDRPFTDVERCSGAWPRPSCPGR